MLNGVPAEARIAQARTESEPEAGAGAEPESGAASASPASPASPREGTADDDPGEDDPGDDPPSDGPSGGGPGDGGPGDGGLGGGSIGGQGGSGSCGSGSCGSGSGGSGSGDRVPARSDLVIPLLTLLGLAARPGEGHGLGPLDPGLARDLATTAARSPFSEWSVTVTDARGYAIGHGRAKPARGSPRKSAHVPLPPLAALPARVNLTIPLAMLPALRGQAGLAGRDGCCGPPGAWTFTPVDDPGVPDGYGTWRLTLPGGAEFTARLVPVPVYDCDHRHESCAYQPNDMLRTLVQVRDGDCTFPTCSSHARESDFEHGVPYDKGGRTCACNAGARSRRCHRVKQSRGWTVTQPRPGWHQWTTPAGRTYTQGPKRYPA